MSPAEQERITKSLEGTAAILEECVRKVERLVELLTAEDPR